MFAQSTLSTQEAYTGKRLRNCEALKVDIFEAEKAKDGKMITYSGAAYLFDGSVILLDVVHYRCCLYDPSHIYKAEIKLSTKPHSVTLMGHRRIAVSLPEENMILVLDVGSVFRVERQVYTDWPCYALASAGDDKIVVCYMAKQLHEVVMINLDGDKKFSFCSDVINRKNPPEELYLAYDKLRKRTCVFDKYIGVIDVRLKDGSERFIYSKFNEIFGRGIDYDQEGNLYFILDDGGTGESRVNGNPLGFRPLSLKINQVSVNGDHLHSWVCDSPSPTALCFHPNGKDFIVANMSGAVCFFKLQ